MRSTCSGVLLAAACSLLLAGCGEADVQQYEPRIAEPSGDLTLRTGVMPVFAEKNCTSCHAGASAQSNLDLAAGGDADLVWQNLMDGGGREASGFGEVVNLASPEDSLLVTGPLPGSTFDHQGQKLFAGPEDPSYLTLLGWVENGAPND